MWSSGNGEILFPQLENSAWTFSPLQRKTGELVPKPADKSSYLSIWLSVKCLYCYDFTMSNRENNCKCLTLMLTKKVTFSLMKTLITLGEPLHDLEVSQFQRTTWMQHYSNCTVQGSWREKTRQELHNYRHIIEIQMLLVAITVFM